MKSHMLDEKVPVELSASLVGRYPNLAAQPAPEDHERPRSEPMKTRKTAFAGLASIRGARGFEPPTAPGPRPAVADVNHPC
jgi:hypothetical protein